MGSRLERMVEQIHFHLPCGAGDTLSGIQNVVVDRGAPQPIRFHQMKEREYHEQRIT